MPRRRDIEHVDAILADAIKDYVTPSHEGIYVLLPLAVGATTTVGTIFIHAVALITIVHLQPWIKRILHRVQRNSPDCAASARSERPWRAVR